jgi:hypothetical protein
LPEVVVVEAASLVVVEASSEVVVKVSGAEVSVEVSSAVVDVGSSVVKVDVAVMSPAFSVVEVISVDSVLVGVISAAVVLVASSAEVVDAASEVVDVVSEVAVAVPEVLSVVDTSSLVVVEPSFETSVVLVGAPSVNDEVAVSLISDVAVVVLSPELTGGAALRSVNALYPLIWPTPSSPPALKTKPLNEPQVPLSSFASFNRILQGCPPNIAISSGVEKKTRAPVGACLLRPDKRAASMLAILPLSSTS